MTVFRLFVKNRPILIRLGTRSDSDVVLKFLQKNFLPYIAASQTGLVHESEENKEHYIECLGSGASVLAVTDDNDNELVGLCLANRFSETESQRKLKQFKQLPFEHCSGDSIGMIFAEEMKLRSQICRLYNIQEALYVSAASIRKDFQGHSLAKAMIQGLSNNASQLGFKAKFGIITTDDGVNLQNALGWHTIYSQKYVEYQDHRGIFVYCTLPSTATASVVAKILTENKSEEMQNRSISKYIGL